MKARRGSLGQKGSQSVVGRGVYIRGRDKVSSRAVIGHLLSSHHNRDRVQSQVTRPRSGCGRARISPRGQGYQPGTARHRHFTSITADWHRQHEINKKICIRSLQTLLYYLYDLSHFTARRDAQVAHTLIYRRVLQRISTADIHEKNV